MSRSMHFCVTGSIVVSDDEEELEAVVDEDDVDEQKRTNTEDVAANEGTEGEK